MNLTLNPEFDVIWLDKSTLQINDKSSSFLISDLPLEMKLILTQCNGLNSLTELLESMAIDERIHEDINEALRKLIDNKILINQAQHHIYINNLRTSFVIIIGVNNFAFEIGHLLAAAGVGRVVFQSLIKKSLDVSLADVNIFGPKAKEIGTPLYKSLRDSLINFGTKCDTPDNNNQPDLVIFCEEFSERDTNETMSKKIPHIFIERTGEQINIGPFVFPGLQTCHNCLKVNTLKKNIFSIAFPKKSIRPLDKNPWLTTLASSLLVANVVSYLSKQLEESNPTLTNMICDLEPVGPGISFRKIQPHPQCGCMWEAA